jgi:hypothetical protein
MLKRLLVSVLPFLATSCRDAAKPTGDVQMLDPKKILFSLPTLCDQAPAVAEAPAPSGARSLHEDDWRQVEFVAAIDDSYIRGELAALATFKSQHKKSSGWTSVYVRKEHPHPLGTLGLRYSPLPQFSASAIALGGRPVRGGFALSDGGGWFIYGQRSPEGGIIQLAVSPSQEAVSDRFAAGLVEITQAAPVLLVDWYAGSIVDLTSPKSVLAWARHTQMQ